MGKTSGDIFDEVFGDMTRTFERKPEPENEKPITFWVPAEYHAKFEELQRRTQREFGRRMKKLVKKTIDKIAG